MCKQQAKNIWNTDIPFQPRLLNMLKMYNAPEHFIVELENAIASDTPLSGEFLNEVAEWVFNYED